MLTLIFIVPALAALAAVSIPQNRLRPFVLPVAGLAHLAVVAALLAASPAPALGWLLLDPLGKVVLPTVSVLFFCSALYAPAYLRLRDDRPNRAFVTSLLLLLATMSLISVSQHVGLMWVAVEATTLGSGPLIYFNRNPQSLEAAWKYLLICSVGVALALLGTFFLAFAAVQGGAETSLLLADLVRTAGQHSKPWLNAAFVTLLVGYGTKMGLAPLHSWKPDAYGEAPGIVGALLAGGLTSCAFLAILRVVKVMNAAGLGAFSANLLVGIGLFSMTMAAVFMVRQRDYKRMLAYSSVEHMGILALGVGLGGAGAFGSLLHLINNALTKGVLFLSSGNIHRAYGSKSIDNVSGALTRLPASAALFLAGFIAITGSPPFGPFVSEFTILRAAFETQRFAIGGAFLLLLLTVFIGMGATVLAVVQGRPPAEAAAGTFRDSAQTVLPIALLLLLVLGLGVYLPPPLQALLQEAAAYLEVGR
ncbi:MAG: hydrogenase [Candidatus Lambdaproteobacteria bacterium]|nr:hydrogenase [Candidatus Lambdaproteobacteria bacterium]